MLRFKVLAMSLLSLLALGAEVRPAAAQAYGAYGHGNVYGRYVPRATRGWVPGHYEVSERSVWVSGGTQRTWVPAAYQTRYDACGRTYRVLLRDGYWRQVALPGRYERRPVRIWVPGRWSSHRR